MLGDIRRVQRLEKSDDRQSPWQRVSGHGLYVNRKRETRIDIGKSFIPSISRDGRASTFDRLESLPRHVTA